jgi:hypothetical protein
MLELLIPLGLMESLINQIQRISNSGEKNLLTFEETEIGMLF